MTDIRFIAPRTIGAEQAARLEGSLTAMLEMGIDPGPRGAQIRSLGVVLTASVQSLREALARFGLTETEVGWDLCLFDRLAHLSRTYELDP